MRATAWSNGSPSPTGSGYGLKISAWDRDRFFEREWADVIVELAGEEPASIRLSQSFWRSCSELRSASIGRWLLKSDLAPWPKGEPPTCNLSPVGGNRFRASRAGR